jgi:Na+-transporting NADH:ubiquinone oxidoreductase subunit B
MMRGIWNRETVALVILAAAIPVAVAWLWQEGTAGAIRLMFAIVVGGAWQGVFTVLRAQPPSASGIVSALAIAMLAPEVGPFQFVLGVSFGFVFGELVFGGWGRSVLSPAVVAIMFLGFGFPLAAWPPLAVPVGWATIPAALLLLALGILPWRVLAGALVVLIVGSGFGLDLLTSAVAVVLVLLVCDPATCASTAAGRWLNGALFGGLIVLFSAIWATAPVQIAVSAALLTALATPLLDEIAIALWRTLRRHRHG